MNSVRPALKTSIRAVFLILILLSPVLGQPPATQPEIDWTKAQQLYRQERAGERLSPDDQTYLDRAKVLRQQQPRAGANGPSNQGRGPAANSPAPRDSTGLKPLTEMSATDQYKGEDGGLYGQGKNEPPAAHLSAALAAARRIAPLDETGQPSPTGKVVLISVGMSNTTQEFSTFVHAARSDPAKASNLVIVDGAQGGQDVVAWLPGNTAPAQPQRLVPMAVLDQRLKAAGVTAAQVRAAWLKQARIQPARDGEFPAHARKLQENLAILVRDLKAHFPNLELVYLSSRIYAGYAGGALNPEPYAYEGAFAVRWLIEDQIAGRNNLNFDAARGPVRAPILLWGPYLWGDGVTPRQADGLTWLRPDLGPDGTHPSDSGRMKVADLLLKFFKTDPTAKLWFTGKP